MVRYLPPETELVSYIARSSIVSAVHATPYLGPKEFGPSIGAFEARMIKHDLEKTGLSTIEKSNPDVIVIDLIDERFRIYHFANTLVTLSAKIAKEKLGLEIKKEGKVVPLGAELYETFSRCATAMLERLSAISGAKILVNEAYWAEQYVSGGDQLTYSDIAQIRSTNDQLKQYYDILRGVIPGSNFIRYEGILLGDPDHVWGAAPFHYTPAYYEHLAGKIIQLCEPVRRPSPAINN